jgi:predicted glycoside hydrolase/deacetylase ChbG (UPF0249 family)
MDRKSRHGGYVELRKTTDLAAVKAKSGLESYKASLKANKQKIKDVLEQRPTLLQRHNEVHHFDNIYTIDN